MSKAAYNQTLQIFKNYEEVEKFSMRLSPIKEKIGGLYLY